MKELNWASVVLCKRLIWLLEELFLKLLKIKIMEAFTWGIMQIKDSQRVIYFLYKLHMVFPSENKI